MNNITWRQLKDFLNTHSDDPSINWDRPIMVHNAETGDEYTCDTWNILYNSRERTVLAINIEEIFNENKTAK